MRTQVVRRLIPRARVPLPLNHLLQDCSADNSCFPRFAGRSAKARLAACAIEPYQEVIEL